MTNLTGQRLYWSFLGILPRKTYCQIYVYAHLLLRYLIEKSMVSLCKRTDEDMRHKELLQNTSQFGQERKEGKDSRERRRKEKNESIDENISRFSSTSMWVLWYVTHMHTRAGFPPPAHEFCNVCVCSTHIYKQAQRHRTIHVQIVNKCNKKIWNCSWRLLFLFL